MRKTLIVFVMIWGLAALTSTLCAQTDASDNPKKMLRVFLNNGEMLDFDANMIDSITNNAQTQTIWTFFDSTAIDVTNIDSICYMTPTLKLSAREMDFGKVKVGNGKTLSFCITNTGKYPETYYAMVEGVFTVEGSGMDVLLPPGGSAELEVTFQPDEVKWFFGEMRVASHAVEDGILSLPLKGKGVDTVDEEENHFLPPEETDFEVMLPEGIDDDGLDDIKILNYYGEYPVENVSGRYYAKGSGKSKKMAMQDQGNAYATGQCSPNGIQCHICTRWNQPFLFSFSLPEEGGKENKVDFSVEKTAEALMMSEPLLVTSNMTEYRNVLQILKTGDLKPYWDAFVEDVRMMYDEGSGNKQCPQYHTLDSGKELLFQLVRKYYDNHELTLDGLSLDDFTRTPEAATYRIRNNYKRVVHAYTSRVKMNEDNSYETKREEVTMTLQEFCQWILDHTDQLADDFDVEDEELLNEMKEWVQEVENTLVRVGLGEVDSHIQMPFILESKHANYWKIAWESLNGATSSIYEVVSDEITTPFKNEKTEVDFDKIDIDIYGMGRLGWDWDRYTPREKFRILFALIHGAYKDVFRPIMEIITGWKEASEATGSDDFKYDLRYGSRKAPEYALILKLSKDFGSDKEKVKALYDHLDDWDFWEATKLVLNFVCERIFLVATPDADEKPTYANLMYNVFKKWTGKKAIDATYRTYYKEVVNNLTQLKRATFLSKVVNVFEDGLDLAGAVDAFCRSSLKASFHIDKSDHPYITVQEPTYVQRNMNGNIHFKWEVYKAKNFGEFYTDLVLYIDSPERKFHVTPLKNIQGNECDINLGSILSSNNAANAVLVKYQLIAHHPENPDAIYVKTEYQDLASIVPSKKIYYTDLGLPSGTWWAKTNLGAETNLDYGNYFAWGETTGFDNGKTNFSWSNYKYCKGSATTLTKYCSKDSYGFNGFTDELNELQGVDDLSSVLYGCEYSIPTKEQWEELMTWCDWTYDYHFKGFKVSGRYGEFRKNHIFLPAAGYRQGMNLYDAGSEGYYWSSTLDENSPDDACFLYFGKGKPSSFDYYRCYGRSIRPVWNSKKWDSQQAPRQQTPGTQPETPAELHSNGMVVKTVSRSDATP